jgi:hypothetical protein
VPRIRLYLDENIQVALADALRARGVDVLTTFKAGNVGLSDLHQLQFAIESKRTLFTYNKRDFAKLHYARLAENREHSGIILSDQFPVGIILRRFMKLYFALSSEAMKNRLEYLSVWK